jgi:pimeloyl-ACP methyl ester carboxylesterase
MTKPQAINTPSRHYVLMGERQVHYRRDGTGPLIVLIHQSPNNSKELLPLMGQLAEHYTVIAPDTPGYGQSDPLTSPDLATNIDAFVDALVSFFDALGLVKPVVYGSHSGAIIGVRLAARYPHKVAALIANGVLINTAGERKTLCDNYFVPFLPQWDGSHLSWLWSRLRDQHSFYPWYERSPDTLIHWPATDDEIESSALNIMESGDNYRGAYRAVLDYAIADDLVGLTIPTLLLVAETDALVRYVADYPPLPKLAGTQIVADFDDIPPAILAFSSQHCVPNNLPVNGQCAGKNLDLSKHFVATANGCFHLLSGDIEPAFIPQKPLLLLHELGSSCDALRSLMMPIMGNRQLIAPDLPGHGESELGSAITPHDMADELMKLLNTLNIDKVDVISVGNASACALALKTNYATHIDKVIFCNPECRETQADAQYKSLLPELKADFAGSHLIRAWHYLRDRSLFYPWYERSQHSMIKQAQPPDVDSLQLHLLSLLKARKGLIHRLVAANKLSKTDYQNCPDAQIATTFGASCKTLLPLSIALETELYRWPRSLWPQKP